MTLSNTSTQPLVKAGLALLLALALWSAWATLPAHAQGPVVNTATDENDGSCADGDCSLRDAIQTANTGETITFNNDYSIYLNSTLSLTKELTIDGSGHAIAISGDSGNDGDRDVQVFNIGSSGVVTLNYLSVISGTTTGDGGGIYNDGTLTVNYTVFAHNNAQFGGGIFTDIGDNLKVTNSTLEDNSADYGGGIFNLGISTVANSTFSNNTATDQGGGIRNVGELTVVNSTLSGNSANQGGGIYDSINRRAHLKNILIANSGSGGDCFYAISLATNLNNMIEDGSCSAAFSGDPLLASLGNYGGGTQTFALLPGSPAIDAGDSATCSGSEVNSLDQRGVTRPAACDIGAFESQGFYLTLSGGNNQSTFINTAFAAPLQVTFSATDTNLSVGAGQVVTFTAPSSGASLSTTSFTATTNSGSVASTAVTANDTVGSYQVTATASEVSGLINFSLTNTEPEIIYLPIVIRGQ